MKNFRPNLSWLHHCIGTAIHQSLKIWAKLDPEKCNFLISEAKFLSHIVNSEGFRPAPEHIHAIVKMKTHPQERSCKVSLDISSGYANFWTLTFMNESRRLHFPTWWPLYMIWTGLTSCLFGQKGLTRLLKKLRDTYPHHQSSHFQISLNLSHSLQMLVMLHVVPFSCRKLTADHSHCFPHLQAQQNRTSPLPNAENSQ